MHSRLTNTDALCCSALVRYWHKADMPSCTAHGRYGLRPLANIY